jgi:hypothetical protein
VLPIVQLEAVEAGAGAGASPLFSVRQQSLDDAITK